MYLRISYSILLLSLLVACSNTSPHSERSEKAPVAKENEVIVIKKSQEKAPIPPQKETTTPNKTIKLSPKKQPANLTQQAFNTWIENFKEEALKAGISEKIFNQAFTNLTPDPAIIKSNSNQPEFTRPVWEYIDGAVSPTRIKIGKEKLIANQSTLEAIEEKYAVDKEVIVAIWGMESGFGAFTGNKQVIRSLATLAFEGRRAKFAHSQLIAALQIIQQGDVSTQKMLGSWAGAMGQTQFIPTTYLQHAVDFDQDGRRDIWNSVPDALASTANYLAQSKWQYGKTWGHQITLPKHFDYAQTDIHHKKTVEEWAAMGVKLMDGNTLPHNEYQEAASILLPAGAKGQAFLVYNNFYSIMRYNNSTSYALAISLLMDNFKGKKVVTGNWPTQERPLSRTERTELQELLNQNGYDAGTADGIIGANTRKAIRAYQQNEKLPADGFPTVDLLNRLK